MSYMNMYGKVISLLSADMGNSQKQRSSSHLWALVWLSCRLCRVFSEGRESSSVSSPWLFIAVHLLTDTFNMARELFLSSVGRNHKSLCWFEPLQFSIVRSFWRVLMIQICLNMYNKQSYLHWTMVTLFICMLHHLNFTLVQECWLPTF